MVYNSSQSTGIQSKNQMPVWLQLNPGKEFMGSVIFTVRAEFSSELFLHECYIWLSLAIVFGWMFFTDTTLRKCSIIMPTFLSPMWTQSWPNTCIYFSGFVHVNIYLSKANKRRKTAILEQSLNNLFFSFREEETVF